MEIGMRLKEAREARNISLDDLQETTKIQKRYLVAIEKGDLHILPGKFYARAFIKEYAIAVGLDPNELLEGLKDEVPLADDTNTVEYTRMQRSRRGSSPEKIQASFSFIPTGIVVLLVIGILFVAWILYQKSSNNQSDPVDQQDSGEIIRNKDEKNTDPVEDDDADSSDQTDDEEVPETDSKEPTFNVVEEGAGNSPESTLDLNGVGEEVLVTLESNSDTDTYLEVKNESGESFYAGMFTSVDSPKELDLSGERKIHFNVGNALGLKITINGAELEYPIDPTNSVHQKLWININE